MQRIEVMGLINTPTSYEQIMKFVESVPAESRRDVILVMGMVHNYLATMHNQMIDNMLDGAMSADEIKEMLS